VNLKFLSVFAAPPPQELQTPNRTRILDFRRMVVSEVRNGGCCEMMRTSETEHQDSKLLSSHNCFIPVTFHHSLRWEQHGVAKASVTNSFI
jgi:hypothetical protein